MRRPSPAALSWLLVGGVASAARALVAAAFPATPYSGDSWCLLDLGGAPPCASHAPAIAWIWRAGTLGSMTESHVLLLQAVLGVVATLLLFGLALRLMRRRLAVLVALAFSLLPVELFFERSFMTEAIATLLFIAALLLGLGACSARSLARSVSALGASSLLLGLATTVHASVGLVAAGLLATLLALVAQKRMAEGARPLAAALLVPVAAVGMLAPAIPTMLRFKDVYGMATTQAMSGTYLAARWAPLLDCPAPAGSLPPVVDFYAVACKHHDYGDPPGLVTKLMWDPTLGFLRSPPPADKRAEFAAAQRQLRSAAIAGMLSHPLAFAGALGDALVVETFEPPTTRALHVYATAAPALRAARQAGGTQAAAIEAWLGGAEPSSEPPSPDLRSLVRATNQLVQVLLWAVMAGAAARLALTWRRRRQAGARLIERGWWRRPASERVVAGLASAVVVSGTLLSWALGSWSIFRMWEPMAPFVLLLLGLCWPAAERGRPPVELG